MTAICITVTSTPEQRYDEAWRKRLTACLAEVRGVQFEDIGGGTFMGPPAVSDNDFEVDGIEPQRVLKHLRAKGYDVKEWGP